MSQVSSVQMTAEEGTFIQKGEQFGYFQFGASDIIMLFEKKAGIDPKTMLNMDTKTGHEGRQDTPETEKLRSRNYCYGASILTDAETEKRAKPDYKPNDC
mmetsp:Transcript_32703/g.29580  ORF Transcript_32703/g.29580 Transcript_32703/m.29580 type:complete len:100 (+) Transcript_32703:1422-1721(+)